MTSGQEARARRLPSRPGRWLLGYRKLGIHLEEGAGQPFMLIVAREDTGVIRATDLQLTAPGAREASDLLYGAMLSPMAGSGARYRPTEVAMDDARLYRELAPAMECINVRPIWERALPMLDEIARSAEGALRLRARPRGLVRAPGTTPAQLAEFFAAAAGFYGADPWEWLGSADPIAVRYPEDAEPIFVMLVAGDTEQPGLNVCLTREDLERYMGEGDVDEETEDMIPEVPVLIMFYADASAMAPDDLAAIKRHGWIIRDDDAYPLFFRVDPELAYSLPSPDDTWRMAAILRTLPEFIAAVGFDRGWVHDTHLVYHLPDIYPERTVALTYPHDLPPGIYAPIEPYEALVETWCPDASRQPLGLAMAAFMARILGIMQAQGYSPSTLEQYTSSFDAIGWLQCRFGPHDSFSPATFTGEAPLVDEFREHISSAKTALERYRRAWRKLAKWARILESLPSELSGLDEDKSE